MFRRLFSRPEALLAITFLFKIVVGTILLRLPAAHRSGSVSWIDACFTATSAVCVTGLTTIDIGSAFSRFGHVVILCLIQLGGLGIMTFAALAAVVFGRRISFAQQAALQDVFFQESARGDLRRALLGIILMTFALEIVGALLICLALAGAFPGNVPWFDAVFHSVSAFCNAGFSLYPDNMIGLRQNHFLLFTVMTLIVAGGLGYSVLFEIGRRFLRFLRGQRRKPPISWSLNTRVVISMSAILIAGGAIALAASGLSPPETGFFDRLFHGLFFAVSARTAGFNTLDLAGQSMPPLILLTGLMMIGGAPGSCAGGVKTTSAAIAAARLVSGSRGADNVNMFGRRLPPVIVHKAALVIAFAVAWNMLGIWVLCFTEGLRPGARLDHILFEQISAFATCGLSCGLTPHLSGTGKLWIVSTMFVGRIGPLTAALAVLSRPRTHVLLPQEQVMIG